MAIKRKAVTRDAPEADKVALSNGGSDAENVSVDGAFSQTGSESELENDLHLREDLEIGSEDEDAESSSNEAWHDTREQSEEAGAEGTEKIDSSTVNDDAGGDDGDDDDAPKYTVTTDANGNPRYLYPPIEPVYDSDDTDAQETANTIGNIPLSFYDAFPHIGYDINGRRIARPAQGAALDALLDTIELPAGWTGLTDPSTGKPLELTPEELELVRRIQMREYPDANFDPHPPTVEYFTSIEEPMPLSAAPEPKRRFVPSKHEAKRVAKIVRAIRQGRIMPHKPKTEEEEEEEEDVQRYDIWANEAPRADHVMHLAAPKLPPPGYAESYHPPPEYLPDAKEKKAWEDATEEERAHDFLPTDHDALRKVPGYERFVKEKFERCLDLYLAPRIRRKKLDIDPESLLPKLPSPEELRPFPTTCATLFRGHKGRVRSVAIDPSGTWLASGGDDGTIRVWELLTGRQAWKLSLGDSEAVDVVRWRPGTDAFVLAAAHGEDLYFLAPPLSDPDTEAASHALLDAGFGAAATTSTKSSTAKPAPAWTRPAPKLVAAGARLHVTLRSPIKHLAWHQRGAHLVTVSPRGASSAVAVHTLGSHRTQFPFRRLRGLAQAAVFHPAKPVLLVATQRLVRAYDLARQQLVATLRPGARWVSDLDVHPRQPDHVLVGAYDRRTLWMDAELARTPYKTLRYHDKAVRAVRFHSGAATGAGAGDGWARHFPLFADASDDGTVQVFHGSVVDDLMTNAAIVPLKVLRGHAVVGQLGVLDLDWHPALPWLVSAGADGTCRLWT